MSKERYDLQTLDQLTYRADSSRQSKPPDLRRNETFEESYGYMDAIALLHKRHLEEKQIISSLRQKL